MKQIDHNPNERKRPIRGEYLFVTASTVLFLTALGVGLRLAFSELGYGTGFSIGGALIIALFLLAFAWERWKARHPG